MDNHKVLLVDDEENILNGLKRQLRKQFNITTATSGQQALEIARKNGPFAVVVSDMRMPGMSGIEVLRQMQKSTPDTTRVMLTGNADQQTAIDAVNEGNVFRFLNKPCETDVLINVIDGAIKQHELVTAERELLEKTLAGSIKVLVDVLSLSNPAAFGNTIRVRDWANQVSEHIKIDQPWMLDIAAALSTLGLIAVPSEVLTKIHAGQNLTDLESSILLQVPELGQKLIKNIPRLMPVAKIIYYQDKGYDGSGLPMNDLAGEAIPLEARVLKILKDLALHTDGIIPSSAAFAKLKERKHLYDEALLDTVHGYFQKYEKKNIAPRKILELSADMLRAGDVLEADLELINGGLFLEAGATINDIYALQIKNMIRVNPVKEPVKVFRKS